MTTKLTASTPSAVELVALTKRDAQGKPAVDNINLHIANGGGYGPLGRRVAG